MSDSLGMNPEVLSGRGKWTPFIAYTSWKIIIGSTMDVSL